MIDTEKILTEQNGNYAGVTAVSESGSLVAVSKNSGGVDLLTESGTTGQVNAPTNRSISHIHISEDGPRGVIASIDGGVVMGFDGGETWAHQYEGLWDITPVHELAGACVCTRPRVGPGAVQYVKGSEEVWEKPLDDAVGVRVAASQDASAIAVGTGYYYLDEDPTNRFGTPSVIFYEWGDQKWSKEIDEDAIGIILDPDNDRIITGLDDGSIAAYTLAGEVLSEEDGIFKVTDRLWSGENEGGFLSVSDDHTSIVSHILGVLRCFDTRGNLQWQAEIEEMSRTERSVQVDRTGDRVLVTTMDEHAYLVDRGELIWEKAYPGGPVRGSLSLDGSTWCVTDENLDTQTTTLNVYQDPDHGG